MKIENIFFVINAGRNIDAIFDGNKIVTAQQAAIIHGCGNTGIRCDAIDKNSIAIDILQMLIQI